jgi:L-threonylcarbamoyladenylate synthase
MKIIKVENGELKENELQEVVDVLKNGGVIIYPTETVYGIGCSVFDQKAIDRIFDLKQKDKTGKTSIMVDSVESIKKYAEVGKLEDEFINRYLPGPVTVILKIKPDFVGKFSNCAINENMGVGFRVISKLDYINKICQRCDFPVLSTSANKSGIGIEKSTIDSVLEFFKGEEEKIDILIDAGDLNSNVPSTVVDLTQSPFQIIRRGAEEIKI